jgi:hypothetical protein
MPRSISDEEYNFLQGRRQVADFVESIYNDPQLTREAKMLIKKKYPNLPIPDLDLEAKVDARLDAEKKERDDADSARRKAAEDEYYSRLRAKTQADYGFTDEAMTRLEKVMVERNIGDYEAAAMLMASREPKTSEPTFDSQHWQHEKQDGFADIAKDPEAWGRNEILKAMKLDEQRNRGGR